MRDFLSRHLFSPLQGMTSGAWWSLLRENRFAIDPPYWPRSMFLSAASLANSGLALLEDRVYGQQIDAVRVKPPLFILGHYRSGTTHLQNLLSLDTQFAYPTLYQAIFPHTFLGTEAPLSPLIALLLMRRRPPDGINLGIDLPMEDEFALCAATTLSPFLGWAFPRRGEDFDRYLTFRDVPKDEIRRWQAALSLFLRKLTWKYDRPLLLKSPPHTARIRLLLGMFPEARFIHIQRDPFAVFQSTRHLVQTMAPLWQFQNADRPDADDRILSVYRAMYDAFFEQRGLIPAGHLCEVAYEDLERDPIGQVGGVYEALGLPGFEEVRPRLQAYLVSIGGYKKNRHAELPEPLRERISRAWGPCFEEWGYPR